ncbi:MAG: hypothetical protein VX627_02135 [Candidatus Thermoplasmatota archaeon]|nr:hypothetical protein [Candidatus Thermoplasmatota archaeon]
MRSPAKTMYVLLLSSILVAGCLNAGTTGSSSAQPMNGPAVDAELLSIEPDYRESGSLREIDITAYHAMLDWNGSIDFAGWDVDLDGIVDYEVTSPNGITDITVDDDDVVESDDFLRFTVAFGAVDSDGNWGWEMLSNGDDMVNYASTTRNSFTATDSDASTSAATDDNLMRVTWQFAEDDLNWAFVSIKLGVGDAVYDCSTDGTEECSIGQDGSDDSMWETTEFLTLSESGSDICSGSCSVDIYVQYRGATVSGTSNVGVA